MWTCTHGHDLSLQILTYLACLHVFILPVFSATQPPPPSQIYSSYSGIVKFSNMRCHKCGQISRMQLHLNLKHGSKWRFAIVVAKEIRIVRLVYIENKTTGEYTGLICLQQAASISLLKIRNILTLIRHTSMEMHQKKSYNR